MSKLEIKLYFKSANVIIPLVSIDGLAKALSIAGQNRNQKNELKILASNFIDSFNGINKILER